MAELFDTFPNLQNDKIILKKMTEQDVDALSEITNNDHVYRYIPPFLYKKSNNVLLTAIKNIGERDFEKKKMIIAGIYLDEDPNRLVGLAEMFDYKKKESKLTIGYRFNESYWHKGLATSTIQLMQSYLTQTIGITTLCAYVMPENTYSSRALVTCGFQKQPDLIQEKNWGGRDIVDLEVYTYSC